MTCPSIPQHPRISHSIPWHPATSHSIPQHPAASHSIPWHPTGSCSIPQFPAASPHIPQHPRAPGSIQWLVGSGHSRYWLWGRVGNPGCPALGLGAPQVAAESPAPSRGTRRDAGRGCCPQPTSLAVTGDAGPAAPGSPGSCCRDQRVLLPPVASRDRRLLNWIIGKRWVSSGCRQPGRWRGRSRPLLRGCPSGWSRTPFAWIFSWFAGRTWLSPRCKWRGVPD